MRWKKEEVYIRGVVFVVGLTEGKGCLTWALDQITKRAKGGFFLKCWVYIWIGLLVYIYIKDPFG